MKGDRKVPRDQAHEMHAAAKNIVLFTEPPTGRGMLRFSPANRNAIAHWLRMIAEPLGLGVSDVAKAVDTVEGAE